MSLRSKILSACTAGFAFFYFALVLIYAVLQRSWLSEDAREFASRLAASQISAEDARLPLNCTSDLLDIVRIDPLGKSRTLCSQNPHLHKTVLPVFFSFPTVSTGKSSEVHYEIRVDPVAAQSRFEQFMFIVSAVFAMSWLLALLVLQRILRRAQGTFDELTLRADTLAYSTFRDDLATPEFEELQAVVRAFNQMSRRVTQNLSRQLQLIEDLRRDAHMDALTELPNRADFDARVQAWLASELGEAPSMLMLCSVLALQDINQQQSWEAGDRVVKEVAETLKGTLAKWPNAIVGRRAGSQFAIFISGIYAAEIHSFFDNVRNQVDVAKKSLLLTQDLLEYGLAFSSSRAQLSAMLSAADTSMRQIRASGGDFDLVDLSSDVTLARPAREWVPLLESALTASDFELFYQPVFVDRFDVPDHFEVLCRIRVEDKLVPAGAFWALVERFGLSERMDRAIVLRVLQTLAQDKQCRLGVNLSLKSLLKVDFREWLSEKLARAPREQLERIVIEMPENILKHTTDGYRPMLSMARRFGVRLSLDHFGVMAKSMAIVQHLPVAMVKLDRRFLQDLDNGENRVYLRALVNIARNCGIKLLAEGVESEEQWRLLKTLEVDGAQGYLLGKPQDSIMMPPARTGSRGG